MEVAIEPTMDAGSGLKEKRGMFPGTELTASESQVGINELLDAGELNGFGEAAEAGAAGNAETAGDPGPAVGGVESRRIGVRENLNGHASGTVRSDLRNGKGVPDANGGGSRHGVGIGARRRRYRKPERAYSGGCWGGDWAFSGGDDSGVVSTADVESQELKRILSEQMAQLPIVQREVLEFAYLCGMSQREIALRTGVPLGTVKTRIELGRKKLCEALQVLRRELSG
jgi:RNA polymerase sigma factor (sigma-70 family)